MTNKNNPKYQSLVAKLREIFQIDRPELDFGIYRILNARAGEVNDYLDNRLAAKVQAALDEVMKGRTTFVIAHRLSTIRKADMILVVRDGRIVEQGTHQELLRRHGYYHDLYSKQFAEEYTKKFGQEPGTYSTEGYDLGTILVKGIDSGAVTRPALLDFVTKYEGQGVARKYQWNNKGELTTNLIWIYKVQ